MSGQLAAPFEHPDTWDVIVVGAGHAGCEAALAAARRGLTVLVLTGNLETVAHMSCNPAIGGVGKGHLVKELDALGGAMAGVIDRTGIQFRRLNTGKGPAVRATRAQADKLRYRETMRQVLEGTPGLALRQGDVIDLMVDGGRARGVVTQMGVAFRGRAVILTTGTFLAGVLHVGERQAPGGRAGEAPARGLSASLARLGIPLRRLKTGTPCRIDARTVDTAGLALQPGDTPPPRFRVLAPGPFRPPLEQRPCWLTWTTAETHRIVRENLARSALYQGHITGTGPRYCPSIEDKVVRFADKERHQIFLEPESLSTQELYPNGISTSLPYDVQRALVRSIPGLSRAELTRPGYAVEYDACDPRVLAPTLETKVCAGLYLAGQLNGTSGYEEAAVQGFVAGANAALALVGDEPLVLGRDQAYIGVLVDDLTTRGADEPYRMMTARAEHRLLLREDNADERLHAIGRRLGLVSDDDARAFAAREVAVAALRVRLEQTRLTASPALAEACRARGSTAPTQAVTLMELLRRPELSLDDVLAIGGMDAPEDPAVGERVEVAVTYEGYLVRAVDEAARLRRLEDAKIPDDVDYATLAGLSNEAREKLAQVRPASIGQAARIPGVTAAALAVLGVHVHAASRRPRA